MQDFARIFDGVEDPRTSNATRHDLHEMLMIALLCVICGGQTCTDMELFGRSNPSSNPASTRPCSAARFLAGFILLDRGSRVLNRLTPWVRLDTGGSSGRQCSNDDVLGNALLLPVLPLDVAETVSE